MDDESGESMEPMEEVPLIQLGRLSLPCQIKSNCTLLKVGMHPHNIHLHRFYLDV